MGLILLEALLAGALFVLIIWWTMFSGRKRGELHADEGRTDDGDTAAPANEKPPKA